MAGPVHQQVEDDQRTQLQKKMEEQLKPHRVGKKGGQAAYSIGQLMQFMHLFLGSIDSAMCPLCSAELCLCAGQPQGELYIDSFLEIQVRKLKEDTVRLGVELTKRTP